MPPDQHPGANDHDHGATYAHLDAETDMLSGYWRDVIDRVSAYVSEYSSAPPSASADLGAGNGVAAVALARHFPQAQVIAVDTADALLTTVRERAQDAGLETRITTLHADLDEAWPSALTDLDLTWASMSLHHAADPDRLLRELLARTCPDGLLAVAELGRPLRYFPPAVEQAHPGLEDRAGEASGHHHREAMPTLGSRWAEHLRTAGWEVVQDVEIEIALDPPLTSGAVAMGRKAVAGLAEHAAGRLDDADIRALTDVAARIADSTDFSIRGSRTLTLARRP